MASLRAYVLTLNLLVNPNSSSTFQDTGPGRFVTSFGDGTTSTGDYFVDNFEISGMTLNNFTMGLGVNTTSAFGLVGIGYPISEAIVSTTQSITAEYQNLPVYLFRKNMINTIGFSLWLNDLQASTGSLLFGGIDTEKYHGDLIRVKVQKDPRSGILSQFTVALTSVQVISSTGTDSLTSPEFPISVGLDSGTTLTFLPTDLAAEIWKEAGASYNADLRQPVIPCSRSTSTGSFAFGFGGVGGPVINVNMSELVLDSTSGDPTLCRFGIQNATASPTALYLFGDTFLRSAYVVHDLVNNEIGLAQTNFNATSSNVVPFASFRATIPSSTPAPNQGQISNNASSTAPPSFSAEPGFGPSNAGSIPSVLDYPQLAIIAISVFLAIVSSRFFMF